MFDGADWPRDCLKLVNATPGDLGIIAAAKKSRLQPGHSVNYSANEWPVPFPVRIVQLARPEQVMFSSTWRVSAGQRELCVLLGSGDTLEVRTLIDTRPPAPAPSP